MYSAAEYVGARQGPGPHVLNIIFILYNIVLSIIDIISVILCYSSNIQVILPYYFSIFSYIQNKYVSVVVA